MTMDLLSKKAERDEVSRQCNGRVLLEGLEKNLRNAQTRRVSESEALEKNSLQRALAYYVNEWSWEKFAHKFLAYEVAEAHKEISSLKQ